MRFVSLIGLSMVFLAACQEEKVYETPDPRALSRDAIGYFCGMIVADHDGPKGQVILRETGETLWFTSVRDTLAYTRLPEETDPVGAIFVSDMSKAGSWEAPGEAAWMMVSEAHFVMGSTRRGGMGAPEVVPFSNAEDAKQFVAEFGGQVVRLAQIPDDALLGSWDNEPEVKG